MVVVLSNNDYKDAVSKIIERDYFPHNERNCNRNRTTSSNMNTSLTDFHRTTTNEISMQLQETLQEKATIAAHKQSLIYGTTEEVHSLSGTTSELRNALFFPVSNTVAAVVVPKTTASSLSSTPKDVMPPPPPRKRQISTLLWNRNRSRDNNDDCSCTTFDTDKTKNGRSNVKPDTLINSSATRFPTKSKRRRRSSTRKNCYNDDQNTEFHWEGSRSNGATASDDTSSYVTDIDATTIDSYSIRSELRKAKKMTWKSSIPPISAVLTTTSSQFTNDDSRESTSMTNQLTYQLPLESSRDLAATFAIQERQKPQTLSDERRQRHSDRNNMIRRQRPTHRSIQSLRSVLRTSYRSPEENVPRNKLSST